MEVLTFEHGEVRLDNELVPGILQNLRVSGKVRFDEQKVDGGSGKKKTPQGWEDCDITFSLILTNDEDSSCYDKLQTLAGMFNAPDDKANPKVMAVTNRHLLARGVRQVVFSRFDSSETDRTDEITVSLGFAEHNPPIVRTEQAQAKSPTPGELAEAAAEKAAKEQPTQEDILFIDAAGYEQGGKA
ncbi:MAG TPA: hypothetical protein H9768_01770 [Candidatus Mailhella merdavium]|nr:hypothetical protein [Candidatus Mailhella merdavium]